MILIIYFFFFNYGLLFISRPPELRVNHAPLHFRLEANPPTWICESSTQTSKCHSGKRRYTIRKNEYKRCFLPAGVLALAGRWSYFHTASSSTNWNAATCDHMSNNKSNLRTFFLTTASLCTHNSDVDVVPTRQGAFLRRSLPIKEKSRATVFQYFLAISWCVQLSGQLIL